MPSILVGQRHPNYLYYDFVPLVTADTANPITSPHTAIAGTTTINDTGSEFGIVGGALRGGTQGASPVWGNERVVGTAVTRAQGRAFAALLTKADFGNFHAILFANSATVGDPSSAGHGWIMDAAGALEVITGSAKVTLAAGQSDIRTSQYLAVIVLQGQGAYILLSTFGTDTGGSMIGPLSIPQYPLARVLWVDHASTLATMYPVYEPYGSSINLQQPTPGGDDVRGMRVLDISTAASTWLTDNGVALGADRFNRTNTTGSLGTADKGTWLTYGVGNWFVNGNQAAPQTPSDASHFNMVYQNVGASDVLYTADITTGADPTKYWACVLRHDGVNSFLTFENNGTSTKWVLGKYTPSGSVLTQSGFTWAANTTYRIRIFMKGNQYNVFVNESSVTGGWYTEATNFDLTGTGFGMAYFNASTASGAPTWDNFGVYPHTVTLPADLNDGAIPLINTVGATLGSDSFSGSAGLLSGHTPTSGPAYTQRGVWSIDGSGHAYCSTPTTNPNFAVQDNGATDVEVSVDITPSNPDQIVRAGVIVRYNAGTGAGITIRCFKDPSQVNTDEIEIAEGTLGTTFTVVAKTQLGNMWTAGSTHTMKVQIKGSALEVFIDGAPRMFYYVSAASLTGTAHGTYVDPTDGTGSGQSPTKFGNYTQKAIS